jgi:hypothetical protein
MVYKGKYTTNPSEHSRVVDCEFCCFNDNDECLRPDDVPDICFVDDCYFVLTSSAKVQAKEPDFTWYKKRFPKIKAIHQNEEKRTTVVILKDGRKGIVKVSEGDEWNSDLGVMHAYVKASEASKGYFNGGTVDSSIRYTGERETRLFINGKREVCRSFSIEFVNEIIPETEKNFKTVDTFAMIDIKTAPF